MAVRFATAGDFWDLTSNGAVDTTNMTLTYWAYMSASTSTFTVQMLFRASNDGTTGWIGAGSGGQVGVLATVGGGIVTNASSFAVGQWARVALVVNGTSATHYLAPTPDATPTVSTGTWSGNTPAAKYSIGGRGGSDSTQPFNGRMAAVKLWSGTQLTAAEIQREWAQTLPVRTDGLFAFYPLDSADAAGRLDLSGNGRMFGTGTAITEDGPPIPRRRVVIRPWLSSAGVNSVTGTATASLGALTATATGVPTVLGTAAASLGALTAAATGTPTVAASAAASLGGLTASATGVRTAITTAAASLGALTAAASGTPTVLGTAAASLGALTATGAQQRVVTGTATASLGALTATASQYVAPTGDVGGQWGDLRSILAAARINARELSTVRPIACPNDGEPLQTVRGRLHCRFDGFIY